MLVVMVMVVVVLLVVMVLVVMECLHIRSEPRLGRKNRNPGTAAVSRSWN